MLILSCNMGRPTACMIQRSSDHESDQVSPSRQRWAFQTQRKDLTAAAAAIKDWVWWDCVHLSLVHVQYYDYLENLCISLDSFISENTQHRLQFETMCCVMQKRPNNNKHWLRSQFSENSMLQVVSSSAREWGRFWCLVAKCSIQCPS